MRILRFLLLLVIILLLASQAARFLIVDNPQKSDAIVVVAGETGVRPAHGLELLRQGMAPRLFLDVEAGGRIYDERLADAAQRFINTLPYRERITVCPITGLSTNAETEDVSRCLAALSGNRVLIVTSDYHTRRAFSIFRKRLPRYQLSVGAAHDPNHFGIAWWTNREWAKTTFDEWLKMIWWECVDRWK